MITLSIGVVVIIWGGQLWVKKTFVVKMLRNIAGDGAAKL